MISGNGSGSMKVGKLGLGLKFSLAVTALIVLTMTGVASLVISFQKNALRESSAQNALAMTRNLAHDAAGPLLVFDPLRLDEMVRTVQEATSSAYAMVTDRSGMIVAHTRRSMLGGKADRLPADPAPDSETVREIATEAGTVREYTIPVHIGSEVLGSASVAYSVRTIDATIDRDVAKLRRSIVLITGIALTLGIAAAFIVSSLLTRPITRLKQKMQDVQAGNLNAEAENPRIVNCWERLDCDKRECPAYGRTRCWAVAGTFCRGAVQGQFAQKIGDCRQCVVYQESCGDEIGELVEVFNQMVKDLRHNLAELETANAEKARMERLSALGEMAATVAHETKNPLNAIRMSASYLRKNFQGDILNEFLSIIEQEALRLNELTTGFLGYSRPAPLAPGPCDLNAVIRSTADLVRQEATDRNIELVVLTDDGLPRIIGDQAQLKQALLNLLVNAMDASGEGDTITVTSGASGGGVAVSVQDTGAGIPEGELEKIFKPFYTTKTRGAGLGLAIVERIVKAHRGTIAVTRNKDRGATFTMTLPADTHAES